VKSFTESLPPSSNADDTLAANTEYLNSRHGKHRLMHLEEEGKVKGSGVGIAKWKRYDYLLQNECFLYGA
jgi:hypothetical protein